MFALECADHEAYWNPENESYGAAQTANLLPLFLGITPAAVVPAATRAYVSAIAKHKFLTNSGIIGAAYMLQTLGKVGHGDIALKIALATSEPSWGFMVEKGPGTIWETWSDSTNSHNHPALAADIGVFLYTLAGVQPSTWGAHGTAHRVITFILDPKTARTVNAASVHVGSAGGRAAFSWAFREQRDHHQLPLGDDKSLLDGHRPPAAVFEVNATIPHGEQGAVEMLIPDPTRALLLGEEIGHCHVLRRAGTPILWSDCDGIQVVEASLLLQELGVFGVEVAATAAVVSLGSGEHPLTLELKLL